MIYQKVSPGAKTAEFAYELTPAQMRANVHQVSVEFSNGASGTVALYARANGRTTYEAVTDGGVAVVFDAADSRTAKIGGDISAIKLTPAGISGGETFTPFFSGWQGDL